MFEGLIDGVACGPGVQWPMSLRRRRLLGLHYPRRSPSVVSASVRGVLQIVQGG